MAVVEVVVVGSRAGGPGRIALAYYRIFAVQMRSPASSSTVVDRVVHIDVDIAGWAGEGGYRYFAFAAADVEVALPAGAAGGHSHIDIDIGMDKICCGMWERALGSAPALAIQRRCCNCCILAYTRWPWWLVLYLFQMDI